MIQAASLNGTVTPEDFRRLRNNGPMSRRRFREHLAQCGRCRLTEYSGKGAGQHQERWPSDAGYLCERGRTLWVEPQDMRETVNPKGGKVSTELVMRFLGFPRA